MSRHGGGGGGFHGGGYHGGGAGLGFTAGLLGGTLLGAGLASAAYPSYGYGAYPYYPYSVPVTQPVFVSSTEIPGTELYCLSDGVCVYVSTRPGFTRDYYRGGVYLYST